MSGTLASRLKARPALLVAAVLSLLCAAVAVAAPQVVGIASAIVNDVRIKSVGAAQYRKAFVRQRVAIADQVQTGESSHLQLLLLDKSKFSVGPGARLTIDRFVYDPNGGSLSASVAKGAFRFMSGRSSPRKETTIKTPAATIGIRGTLLDGVVGEVAVAIARNERAIGRDVQSDPETATLAVLRGPGPRTAGKVRVGEVSVTGVNSTVVLDQPLLAAYVPYAGAEPIGPFKISLPGLARLDTMILPAPDRLPTSDDAAQIPYPRRDRAPERVYAPAYPGGPGPGSGPGGYPGQYGQPGDYGAPGMPGYGDVPGRSGLPVDPGQRPQSRDPMQTPANPTANPTPNRQTPTPAPTATPTGSPGGPPANNPNNPTPNNPRQPIP